MHGDGWRGGKGRESWKGRKGLREATPGYTPTPDRLLSWRIPRSGQCAGQAAAELEATAGSQAERCSVQ